MSEHTPIWTESTMDHATAKKYLSDYSNSGTGLGEVITEEMMDSYDGYDAGKSIRGIYTSCDTQEEWELADRMFSALTGFTLHEITASTNTDPYSYIMPCGWHDKKSTEFTSLEKRKDFYFKDRSPEEISELGAAALMAGGSEDAYDVESAYLSVFESAKDDRQAQLCDAMGIAVTGFSFDSLLDMCGCKHERPAPEKKEKKAPAR